MATLREFRAPVHPLYYRPAYLAVVKPLGLRIKK
jgi:hypothetical protein